jgi:site-specific DNA recombinase
MLKNPIYIGKLRWRDAIYEGNHAPIVPEVLFVKAQEIVEQRAAELVGRRFSNGNGHLLTGVVRCGLCKRPMVGVSGNKNGSKIRYYACSRRLSTHDCDQDYVRADDLEQAMLADLKMAFLDGKFVEDVWQEASRLLGAEKPDIETELAKVERERAKTAGLRDKYFAAFEAGTLKAELCGQKIEEIQERLGQLDEESKALQGKLKSLALPALDKEALAACIERLDKMLAETDNPQKKHLLHLFVKKVLIPQSGTFDSLVQSSFRRFGGRNSASIERSSAPGSAGRGSCERITFGSPNCPVYARPS